MALLRAAGVPTPEVDARLLAAHAQGDGARLAGLARRRAAREPLQLIVGTVGFRHLDLDVRPGVFIPRPETETLAGEAIGRVPRGGVVVEPCTGTGAVACAVATESAAGQVVATDISPAAVELARANADRCGAAVTVLEGDLLKPVHPALRGGVDVLVSNPPYLAESELAATEQEVRRWDPPAALVAGPTGHEASDRLIAAAGEWLAPGGWLLLEVDETRAAEAARRCRSAGLVQAGVVRDLAGRDRVVAARLPAAHH